MGYHSALPSSKQYTINSTESDEKTPLLSSPSSSSSSSSPTPGDVGKVGDVLGPLGAQVELRLVPRALKRRWYILATFSSLSFIQGLVWNMWGPISQSAFKAYPDWNKATIALLSDWGCITYILFMVPLCWLMQTKGLRFGILISCTLLILGTGIRDIPYISGSVFTILIHAGHILNGIAGVVLAAAPPMISALWFPPSERTCATAIACQINTFGAAFSFILGPLIVREAAHPLITNGTQISNKTANMEIERDISWYLQGQNIATILVFFLLVWYFPAKPHRPPCNSAAVSRFSFTKSISLFLRHKSLMILLVAYSVPLAIFGTWTTVMDLTLFQIGFSQMEIGWIGFIMNVVGCISSIVIARFSDVFRKRLKLTILGCLALVTVCYVLFHLVIIRVIVLPNGFIYAILIVIGMSILSLAPLYMELAVEAAYPVDEGVIGGILSGGWNFVGSIFLLIFLVPNIGVIWMNWCLIASSIVAFVLLLFVKERYTRSELDNRNVVFPQAISPDAC